VLSATNDEAIVVAITALRVVHVRRRHDHDADVEATFGFAVSIPHAIYEEVV
jgi:hypothetical protein